MTYIELINRFWDDDEYSSFSPTETRLYFFLLHLTNRSYWKESIEYSDNKLVAHIGVSIAVIRTARNRLKEANLINFDIGGKGFRVKTRYQILTPKFDAKSYPNQHSNQDPSLDAYIKNKIKTNKNNYNKQNDGFSKRAFITSESDFD